MLRTTVFLLIALLTSCGNTTVVTQNICSSDVDLFWTAYDKIVATNDSTLQYQYLNDLYIDKGSIGLKNIMAARNYTASEYLEAINKHPKFWASIRANTYLSHKYDKEINASIQKLKSVYPDLQPAPIYFTIGAFRTGGTVFDNTVLIGCEMSFADKSTVVDELPEWRKAFFSDYNPIDGLELLCTHEYVHTQQSELVDNLLTYCIYEGVAEFVSTNALGIPSNTPSIQFGKDNESRVKKKFEQDLFISKNTYNWIWGENKNELKVRDLGYYIGYSICENYFAKSKDKKQAIKEMIELDFSNEVQIENFVDASNFLSDSLFKIHNRFEQARPTIISIEPSIKPDQRIPSGTTSITICFSTAMDKESGGFDFGPLGEKTVMKIEHVIGFSEDGKSFTFRVKLKPNTHYQTLVSDHFVSEKGIPLKPFLINLNTINN